MKITKNQLRRIIKEEKSRLQEMTSINEDIFSEDFYYDLLVDHVELHIRQDAGVPGLTRTEQDMMRAAMMGAFRSLVEDFGL